MQITMQQIRPVSFAEKAMKDESAQADPMFELEFDASASQDAVPQQALPAPPGLRRTDEGAEPAPQEGSTQAAIPDATAPVLPGLYDQSALPGQAAMAQAIGPLLAADGGEADIAVQGTPHAAPRPRGESEAKGANARPSVPVPMVVHGEMEGAPKVPSHAGSGEAVGLTKADRPERIAAASEGEGSGRATSAQAGAQDHPAASKTAATVPDRVAAEPGLATPAARTAPMGPHQPPDAIGIAPRSTPPQITDFVPAGSDLAADGAAQSVGQAARWHASFAGDASTAAAAMARQTGGGRRHKTRPATCHSDAAPHPSHRPTGGCAQG